MNHLAPALLLALAPGLALADATEVIVPIAVTGTVFGFSAVMIGIIAYTRHRNQRLRHETIRLAIEKGQPLPAEMLDPDVGRDPGFRDFRRGLLLLAIGLGVALFLFFAPPDGAPARTWAVGFIPGLMGLAYLASYAVAQRQGRGAQADRG